MKKFLALSLSDVVFIMLINVKMPTIVGILTFMSRINFVAWKKLYNLRARWKNLTVYSVLKQEHVFSSTLGNLLAINTGQSSFMLDLTFILGRSHARIQRG